MNSRQRRRFNRRFPHVVFSRADWDDTTPWLETNVGRFNQDWYKLGRDIVFGIAVGWPGDEYRFRRAEHAMWFKLQWS